MNRHGLAALLLILAAALSFVGCGGAAEKTANDGKAGVAPPAADAPSPAPAADVVAAPTGGATAPATSAVAASSQQGTSTAPQTRGPGGAPPAKAPTPQIGSGGNDLFLFTRARAAVNNDADLKSANVVIDVKEGVVTLSGTVANAALKSKAEQLARGVGPKDVRNQLRVSAGK